jgi:hypothetical protein
LNPGADLDIYRTSPRGEQVRRLAGGQRLYISADEEEALKYKRFLRFDAFDPGEDWMNLRAVMLPNANILDGVVSTNNFDPLLPGRFVEWMDRLSRAEPAARQDMLELMDVSLVENIALSEPFGIRFSQVSGGARLRWLPCAWYVSDGQMALDAISMGRVDLNSYVILEQEDQPLVARCEPSLEALSPKETLSVQEDTPNRVGVHLSASTAGWLVLSDVWYPGWHATVDGQDAALVRGNYLYRAISVPAGEHKVVFSYRPASFWMGLAIGLAALLIFVVIAWRGYK